MRKKICFILATLTLVVASVNTIDVYGDTTVNTISSSGVVTTKIKATKSSTFTVGVPAVITLDKTTGKQDYTVTAKGDIAYDEVLKVEPIDGYSAEDGDTTTDVNVLLKEQAHSSTKKDDIVSDVTLKKQSFDYTDLEGEGTETTGDVTAKSKITAGSWQGILNFNVTLTTTSSGD